MIGVALSESRRGQLDEVHACTGRMGLYKALFREVVATFMTETVST